MKTRKTTSKPKTKTRSGQRLAGVSASAKGWEWYGSAAHLCVGRWCRFHMATRVGNYLVSTVGEYVHPRHSNGSETAEAEWLQKHWPGEDIGCGRKYETMVFRAGKPCRAKGCDCGMPEIDGHEIDSDGYNTASAARSGHMAMCHKYSSGLSSPSSKTEVLRLAIANGVFSSEGSESF